MAERFYKWTEVRPLIGNMGRTTWWRLIRSGQAPAGIQVSPGRVAWSEADIIEWQKGRRSYIH